MFMSLDFSQRAPQEVKTEGSQQVLDNSYECFEHIQYAFPLESEDNQLKIWEIA